MVDLTRDIEVPRVYIHGFPAITESQWEALAPRSLWTEVYEHPVSKGVLWTGGTADNQDMSYFRHHFNPAVGWEPDITLYAFDAVVTLYAPASPADWFVSERRFAIYDGSLSNWSDDQYEELADLVADTHRRVVKGQVVLVRCQAGINRSGLVTALVLMRLGHTAQEAIDLIRSKRSQVCLANKDFVRFLHSDKALELIKE